MENRQLGHDGQGPEPNVAQARRNALKAHDVVIKLKEMGLPEGLDKELARLSTDLGDLWGANRLLSEQLDLFLEATPEWGELGDRMADIRASVDHMAWHLKSIRGPLTRVTTYAYKNSDGDGEDD